MFDYVCNKCGHEFFEVVSYKDRDSQRCDKCQSVDIKRKISNAHFVMDGKMQTLHPNSPDGQARASEIRKKHIRNHTHREFKQENKERAKRDNKWTYQK